MSFYTEFKWRGRDLEASIPSFCQGQGKLFGADQASSGGDKQTETENQGKVMVGIARLCVDTDREKTVHRY